MKALGGALSARAGGCLEAGCDIALCCNFELSEKIDTAKKVVPLAGKPLSRATRAINAVPATQSDVDVEDRYRELASLIKPAEAA